MPLVRALQLSIADWIEIHARRRLTVNQAMDLHGRAYSNLRPLYSTGIIFNMALLLCMKGLPRNKDSE